ncbi:MAG: phage tail tape measure protein, partial [Candidatus Riesia sp.]|nr:phage tail tape measure protein [Candidatus Riesia sp.]
AVGTRKGLDTTKTIRALRQVLAKILKPSKEASDTFKELNIDISEQRLKSEGLIPILTELFNKTQGNSEALGQAVGNVRAFNLVMGLARDGGRELNNALLDLQDGNVTTGATMRAVGEHTQSLKEQFEAMKTQLRELALAAGELLVPALKLIVEGMANTLKWFNSWPDGIKDTVLALGSLLLLMKAINIAVGAMALAFGGAGTTTVVTMASFRLWLASLTSGTAVVGGMTGGVAAMTTTMYTSAAAVSFFAVAVGGLALGIAYMAKEIWAAEAAGQKFAKELDDDFSKALNVTDKVKGTGESIKTAQVAVESLSEAMKITDPTARFAAGLKGLQDIADKTGRSLDDVARKALNLDMSALNVKQERLSEVKKTLQTVEKTLFSGRERKLNELTQEKRILEDQIGVLKERVSLERDLQSKALRDKEGKKAEPFGPMMPNPVEAENYAKEAFKKYKKELKAGLVSSDMEDIKKRMAEITRFLSPDSELLLDTKVFLAEQEKAHKESSAKTKKEELDAFLKHLENKNKMVDQSELEMHKKILAGLKERLKATSKVEKDARLKLETEIANETKRVRDIEDQKKKEAATNTLNTKKQDAESEKQAIKANIKLAETNIDYSIKRGASEDTINKMLNERLQLQKKEIEADKNKALLTAKSASERKNIKDEAIAKEKQAEAELLSKQQEAAKERAAAYDKESKQVVDADKQ